MDILKFLRNKLSPSSTPVTPAEVKAVSTNKDNADMFRAYGITNDAIRQVISDSSLIQYERSSIYQVVDRSLAHALISSSCVAFADCATQRSPLHGSTVWVTSDSKEYRYQIEKMLDVINIEEVIYDWTWTMATFGDHFAEVFGEPGVGIVCVNDDIHPIGISRIDYNGRLVGFFSTPQGYATADTRKLLSPWSSVHFRLLGSKKRRPLYQDQSYSEFRTINIMTPDARRLTSKYGQSVLADALPVWKRLRLAEDSIMMARIMKSPQRFLFKVVIPEDNANSEAVAHLVDQYMTEIKRSRAMNLDPNNPNYMDRFNAPAGAEDFIFPVWGSAENLTVETLGGECLRGDVKIRLMDGTSPTIKEMADNKDKYIGKDVYACTKDGDVVGRRINNVLMTRPNTDFVRVHLDNDEHFDVTPDHPCMLRNGTFKHAELLQPGDSLMPLYTRKSENKKTMGYEEVYIPKTGEYRPTHRVVAEDLLESEREIKYKEVIETGVDGGLVVHHKDLHKENNDSSNLQWMGWHEHWMYHASLIAALNLKREGKTYEEIYGEDQAVKMKQQKSEWLTEKNNKRWSKLTKEERSEWWDRTTGSIRKKVAHKLDCDCNYCKASHGEFKTFDIVKDVVCEYCGKEFTGVKAADYMNHVRWNCAKHERVLSHPVKPETRLKLGKNSFGRRWVHNTETFQEKFVSADEIADYLTKGYELGRGIKKKIYKNHKVVRVERLNIIEDAYDLVIEGARNKNGGPEHCFALACGVFVHNTDIKWIADIDKLENQLITALKVPKQLLAGYASETGGGFDGGKALEVMDIRFARQARRIQRSMISGLTRMAQIHLAYLGMDPDLNLFQIHMCESSSAEEIELQEALGKSVEATRSLYDLLSELIGVDLDKKNC